MTIPPTPPTDNLAAEGGPRSEMSEIAKVLAGHLFMPCSQTTPTVSAWWAQCYGCDWRGPRRSRSSQREADHRAHLADALADLLAARDRQVRAKALREAASDLQQHAVLRFDEFGPLDQRGAAIWDSAAWLTERIEADA